MKLDFLVDYISGCVWHTLFRYLDLFLQIMLKEEMPRLLTGQDLSLALTFTVSCKIQSDLHLDPKALALAERSCFVCCMHIMMIVVLTI